MFTPEGHEVDRVLRASALLYLLKLTTEKSISAPTPTEGDNTSTELQLDDKPLLINKDLQRFKWLLKALADLVFCRYSQSDLVTDENENTSFSEESLFLAGSSNALKEEVLELANAIRTNLTNNSGWSTRMNLNRREFLSSIAPTVTNEILNIESSSNRIFLRVKLQNTYDSTEELKETIASLWGRTSSDTNQMDTQPWFTPWILQPTNERRSRADALLLQAISKYQNPSNARTNSDVQGSTDLHMDLIVKEACLAEDSKKAEIPKDSIKILSAEFNTILAYEFDTSGYLSKQEFIAAFKEELSAQEHSRKNSAHKNIQSIVTQSPPI